MATSLIFERGEDPVRGDLDDFAAGWIRVPAVDAEGDPAGIVAALDAAELLGRHRCRIEVVHAFVEGIADPHFAFVGREAYAVARAAVALDRASAEALHFHAVQFLPGREIANLETEQAVHIHKTERALAIHGEGADRGAEGASFLHHLTRAGIHYSQ